jgi:putative transposase
MALSQSALLDVLDALKAGESVEMIRDAVPVILQELIEAEATAVIGAERHERTESRVVQRNGHRDRVLSTRTGDIELAIPKLRAGSFFPSLLERRRRIDQALFAVVMEAYVSPARGCARSTTCSRPWARTPGSPSPRSRGSARTSIRGRVLRRPGRVGHGVPLRVPRRDLLQGPHRWREGRKGSRVASQAVVVATGVSADGRREVLGSAVGDSEDRAFWTTFLRSLKARGLTGTRRVISDAPLFVGPCRGSSSARFPFTTPARPHDTAMASISRSHRGSQISVTTTVNAGR